MTTLTPNLYYSRLSSVTSASLIITRKEQYFLTPSRSVVYYAHMRIENVLDCNWNVNAIDSFTLYLQYEFPKEEFPQNQLQAKHMEMLY
jgi:hypothetical protein